MGLLITPFNLWPSMLLIANAMNCAIEIIFLLYRYVYIYIFIFYMIKKRIWSRYNIIDFLRVLFYIILYIVYKNDYTDIYRLKIKRNRYLDIIRVYFLVYDVHSTESTMEINKVHKEDKRGILIHSYHFVFRV